MLQIQAPAEVLRLLQSSAAVVADAKTIKDVQSNVRLVAQELEARTERLASCLSGITGDRDGVKPQTERLLNAASDHHVALNNANGKFKELGEQIQRIESAVTHMSRRQVTFESTMETRLGALENQIIQLQAQATSADGLRDEVASMKAALSSLEHQQPNIQQSAQIKSEESETRIQRRMDEMDVLLKHFFERVDGNEKLGNAPFSDHGVLAPWSAAAFSGNVGKRVVLCRGLTRRLALDASNTSVLPGFGLPEPQNTGFGGIFVAWRSEFL